MKINWKEVAASSGYQSLKAAYIKDVTEAARDLSNGRKPMRNKEEFLKQFNWVINRAKHYAYHRNTTIDVILDEWEEGRSYWWLNYYQNSHQPKLNQKSKTMGVNGLRKYLKKYYSNSPKYIRLQIGKELNKNNPKRTKKARWDKQQHRYREILSRM